MAKENPIDAKIEVSGFRNLDDASYAKLKKILEKFAGRFGELCEDFQLLSVNIKTIHKKEKSEKYEIKGSVRDRARRYHAQSSGFDFFAGLNEMLTDLENALIKRK